MFSMISASLLALLAACGVPPESDPPEKAKPPPTAIEENGQHFCCATLGGDGSGNGCVTVDKSHIAACDKLLYCGGTYEKDGGKVTCID